MPRRPDSGFGLPISDGFDDSNNYRVKLWELEERDSQFGNGMALVWKMNIYDQDGIAFEDTRYGTPFDLWAWTSDSTFASANTGQRAKARQYAEAFVGRELSDDEINRMIDDGFAEALVGKMALGSFEVVTTQDGNQRLNVIKLRPVPSSSRGAAPAPAPTPMRGTRQMRIDD